MRFKDIHIGDLIAYGEPDVDVGVMLVLKKSGVTSRVSGVYFVKASQLSSCDGLHEFSFHMGNNDYTLFKLLGRHN